MGRPATVGDGTVIHVILDPADAALLRSLAAGEQRTLRSIIERAVRQYAALQRVQ